MNTDFQCERKLRETKPEYHELVRNTAFVMNHLLDKYTTHFPEYTDHSSLHALQVIDFCNRLIGPQIGLLNPDEIYVLLMGCYLHDTGMGISENDYQKLYDKVVTPEFIAKNPDADAREVIRSFHHEFSGQFIRKYADFFEIPSQEHLEAIILVSRGHRKTNLYDPLEYPDNFTVPNGNTISLPYLASLIRLADEMDIAADRNILFDFSEHEDNLEWCKHQAIKHLDITDGAFVLSIETDDQRVLDVVEDSALKLQDTLELCRDVTAKRTPFKITQQYVMLRKNR